jgi:hypothetical protein
MVSEFSVHGWLAPLLLGHGKAEYHGGEYMVEQSCSPCGAWETDRKREERERKKKREREPRDTLYPSKARLR